MEGNSTLGGLMKLIKGFHEEGEWIFIILKFSYGILESFCLSIAW